MRRLLLAVIAAVLLAACADRDSYRIDGSLRGVDDGATVSLIAIDGDMLSVLDSAVVRNGRFVMKGQTDTCRMAFVTFDVEGELAGCQLFLEKGDINLFYDAASTIQNISGTPCNDAFQSFYDVSLQLDEEVEELQDKLQMTVVTGGEGREFVDGLNELQDRFKALVASSIEDNCDNLFGYEQLQQYFELFEPEEDLEFLKLFLPSFGGDMAFLNMTMTLQKLIPTTAGHPFIDFTANVLDSRGKIAGKASLSDYVKSSSLVYLSFWASYVPSFASDNDDLKAALDGYRSKGFQVVSVSVDDETDEWISAVRENSMTWPQLWNGSDDPENSAAARYAVSAVPMSFLIDSEGTIIGRNIQADELEAVLADYFK